MGKNVDPARMNTFIINIRYYMEVNHLKTQKEFAAFTGVNEQTASYWFSGDHLPSDRKMKQIADAFAITVPDLVEDHTDEGNRRRTYHSVRENTILSLYREDPDFQEYVDFGLKNRGTSGRLRTYVEVLEKM